MESDSETQELIPPENEIDDTESNTSKNIKSNKPNVLHNVSQFELTKALGGIASFGNMLYSAAKKRVNDINIFQQITDELKKGKTDKICAALPPWSGYKNEDILKEECFNLSKNKSNFIRNPPLGTDFHFDYSVSYPIAVACMEEDGNLQFRRFHLVPRVIKEEVFWRNYFYRVSLIFQAYNLQFESFIPENAGEVKEMLSDESELLGDDELNLNDAKEDEKGEESRWEKELEAELGNYDGECTSANDNVAEEISDLIEADASS